MRNAIARFDQVEGVTDEERDRAWERIRTAATKYGVRISKNDWRDLFVGEKKRSDEVFTFPVKKHHGRSG